MTSGDGAQVRFGILGTAMADVAGVPIALTSAKTRIVLASLLVRPGRTVTTADLVERLWDHEPAKGARNTAQSYVMRLRAALGGAGNVIRTLPSGYAIAVPDTAVDLGRFRRHIAHAGEARESGDLRAEARELRTGLALWRGTPLSDVPSDYLHRHEVPGLLEEHLQTLERRIDVDLDLGLHAGLVAELHGLTAEHRLRERFWGQLMLALVRSERQADALAAFREVSALLRDELGVDPGEPLHRLHQQILSGATPPTAPITTAAPAAPAEQWIPPLQLPTDIADFVGRDAHVRGLDELTDPAGARGKAVPIAVLSGPPGVGKTALAIHAAHRLAPRFPDGQLYIDLRGYSTNAPVSATDALTRLLRALGTPPDRIPLDLDDQSALFRSVLANRQILVVLDNAISPDQIRPLLPGSPTCAVLATSRDNLHSLVALNGAHRMPVDLVSPADARDLLSVLLGADTVAAEPDAVDEFAATCGYLPLAIRIAAANLSANRGQSVADYVRQIGTADRLAAMAIEGDDRAAVHLAFDLSYSILKPDLARFFRLLSLVPGPDFDRHAAASLAGTTDDVAKRMLDQLLTANLAHSRSAGRYQFHDLISEFARKKSTVEDTPDERQQAIQRLFEFYVDTARAAKKVAQRDARAAAPNTGRRPSHPDITTPADARAWFKVESGNLVAIVCDTSHHGVTLPSWSLAKEMLDYFQRQRLDAAWRATFTAALVAADERAERSARAEMEMGLGQLEFHQVRYDKAKAHYLRAAALCHESADLVGEARSLTGLGAVAFDQGAYGDAITRFDQAVELYQWVPGTSDHVTTLYNLGIILMMSGDTQRGVERFRTARQLARALDLRLMEARVAASTAMTDLWRGRLRTAAAGFSEALAVMRDLDYPQYASEILRSLAEVSLEGRDPDKAAKYGEQALEISKDVNSRWHTVGTHTILGHIALLKNDTSAAADHFATARSDTVSVVRHWNSPAARGLAECHRRTGRLDLAVSVVAEAVLDPRPRERGRTHAELAKIHLARGDHQTALAHAEQAVEIGHAHGYRLDEARGLRTAGDLRSLIGDEETARVLRARADEVLAEANLSDQPEKMESPDVP
jgi:DNA-binding SARP family transcriptional activator/tetratricopeptide (TPR) repeat protein